MILLFNRSRVGQPRMQPRDRTSPDEEAPSQTEAPSRVKVARAAPRTCKRRVCPCPTRRRMGTAVTPGQGDIVADLVAGR